MGTEATLVGGRRTAARPEAVGSLAAGSPGSTPECRRGGSLRASAVRKVPAMKCLLGRLRNFAMFAPGVEAVVDDEARQVRQRRVSRGDGGSIGGRMRQQFAGRLHGRLFDEGNLVALHELLAPGVDLLVDVDLDRADV